MDTRSFRLMTLAIVFLALIQGCSFYARLGASRQSDLTNVAVNSEKGAGISAPQSDHDQVAFANSHDIR